MRFLCKGKTEPISELYKPFNKETRDGKNMDHFSKLLGDAIASITVCENIIVQIGRLTVEQGNSLDEQIVIDEQRSKLQKEIARLENLARAEKQLKKKFELVQKINESKKELLNV